MLGMYVMYVCCVCMYVEYDMYVMYVCMLCMYVGVVCMYESRCVYVCIHACCVCMYGM